MTSNKIVIAFDIDQDYIDRIRNTWPELNLTICTEQDQIAEALTDADAVVGWGRYDAATTGSGSAASPS